MERRRRPAGRGDPVVGGAVGPAIAGITLALWGTAVNFGINSVSYLAVLAGLVWSGAFYCRVQVGLAIAGAGG